MAAPIASKIILPDDSGNTGKKIRTQTRVVGADTVHEHFYVPISQRRVIGIYSFVAAVYTVLAAAQNGTTTGILWMQNPVGATTNARLRALNFMHTNATATAIDHNSAPRIAAQRYTYTGSPTGANITPGKHLSTMLGNQSDVRSAVTGMTPSLVANPFFSSVCPGCDFTTAGMYNSFYKEDWRPPFEDEFLELVPGEGVVIYQIDNGTTSDQRRVLVTGTWDEVDNT